MEKLYKSLQYWQGEVKKLELGTCQYPPTYVINRLKELSCVLSSVNTPKEGGEIMANEPIKKADKKENALVTNFTKQLKKDTLTLLLQLRHNPEKFTEAQHKQLSNAITQAIV